MRRITLSVLGIALAGIAAACNDQPRPAKSSPFEPMFAKGGGGSTCSSTVARQIDKDLKDLYGNNVPAGVASAWATIQASCLSDPTTAKATVLSYVDAMLTSETLPESDAARAALILSDWNNVFTYAGYTGTEVPNLSSTVLLGTGGVKVIYSSTGGEVKTGDDKAGIYVPAGSTPDVPSPGGSYLFVIEPYSNTCLSANLTHTGRCYSFSVFPAAAGWDPALVVGVCQDLHASDLLPTNLHIGHKLSNGNTEILARPSSNSWPFSFLCTHLADAPGGFAWLKSKGPVGRFLASLVGKLAPTTLYAGHGGLGGEGGFDGGFSPAGDANVQTVSEDFAGVTTIPSTLPMPFGSDFEITYSVKPPGSVTVNSIGNLTKAVVMNQAGGACANSCGGLDLRVANKDSVNVSANATYRISWRSLQNKPSVKNAPIVVRAAGGAEIARVVYATVSSQPNLYYNPLANLNQSTPIDTWTQNVNQLFELYVDFKNDATCLAIDGQIVAGGNSTGVPFVQAANNFARLGFELIKIDAGILAADDFNFERLPDLGASAGFSCNAHP